MVIIFLVWKYQEEIVRSGKFQIVQNPQGTKMRGNASRAIPPGNGEGGEP